MQAVQQVWLGYKHSAIIAGTASGTVERLYFVVLQIRAAIGDHMGTKLVIIESWIASNLMTTTHTPRMVGDVHMMVQYGDAKERTEYQFAELLNASGFKLNTLVPTKGLFFVLEASPV
eukprot:GHRR01018997.1.p1 GENE.GHRR01018997.1~~GHRR01018997.1.p1  ORF type:complete len:118 (-),score=32.19 GHRR01018997.1:877-1230(-)